MRSILSVMAVLATLGCAGGPSGPKFPAAGDTHVQASAVTPASRFITGVSEFYLGLEKDQDATKTKNCEEVRRAEQLWQDAEADIHVDSTLGPQAAAEVLQTIRKYLPALAQQEKVMCKKGAKNSG